jgi:uncharacterized protein (TIGR02118 family)
MIRVSVMYPNGPGRKFDMNYYVDKHMVMVHRMLDPVAQVRTEVDRGIGTAQPGAPAPFVAAGHMYFKSMEDMQRCMSCAAEMMADIPNFTDAQPQIQISEVL